ncbi:RagB/SusD family nutrient uptake outer membrane protein [Aestuariibaculum sp. M13]|uniref:RagB/SusD family nutrient uptake outer membrane protein n=1 Tax=Aestuariibaculum sp. M13 TaxID=2967132 RepID=UPI00215A01DB|nr:RagB/SusD family nutrient uptake outer membrane protein [Aestuariibaculum sp. M13]MCR8668941.1 RagB/SusD family nutrient uptake outer membrane protein [Aestuariibaculum sp. M13]
MKNKNIHNKAYEIISMLLILIVIVSCDEFLDEPPSTSTNIEIKTIEQLDNLLNDFAVFYEEGNRTSVYSTDDYELPLELFNQRPSTFNLTGIQYYTWDIDNIMLQTDNYWTSEFEKIFYANVVLDNLDNVSGPASDKARLESEARFLRAYSYFQLVNTYCLPYSSDNLSALGLPIKTIPNYEESLDRNSLEQTYDFIESDILKSLELNVPILQSGQLRTWRANTAAVNALAARFYLAKQDYEKAQNYAQTAIDNHPGMVDYNTDMYYGMSEDYILNPGTIEEETFTMEYPYGHDNQTDPTDRLNWGEFMYARLLYHASWWYIPSEDLLSLYDQENDLRYKYHIVEGYSYNRGMTNPAYNYPGYIFFYKSDIPSGPTAAEMHLIKAESQVRMGDVSGAMTTVNQVYIKRTLSGTPSLVASNQDDALLLILEERRRELPFTQRWFDIRRYNSNSTSIDDVTLTREFYEYTSTSVLSDGPIQTYTLPIGSNRYAAPIPDFDVVASQGELVQNPY